MGLSHPSDIDSTAILTICTFLFHFFPFPFLTVGNNNNNIYDHGEKENVKPNVVDPVELKRGSGSGGSSSLQKRRENFLNGRSITFDDSNYPITNTGGGGSHKTSSSAYSAASSFSSEGSPPSHHYLISIDHAEDDEKSDGDDDEEEAEEEEEADLVDLDGKLSVSGGVSGMKTNTSSASSVSCFECQQLQQQQNQQLNHATLSSRLSGLNNDHHHRQLLKPDRYVHNVLVVQQTNQNILTIFLYILFIAC